MGFAYGFCSACGLFVTPVHNILPFLLLGIGIDDVFVIIQNWQLSGGKNFMLLVGFIYNKFFMGINFVVEKCRTRIFRHSPIITIKKQRIRYF